MNLLIKLVLILISLLVIYFLCKKYEENFDGYGKGFSTYYHPMAKCEFNNNCFKGSYVRDIKYNPFPRKKPYLNCCVTKHLKRNCKWN